MNIIAILIYLIVLAGLIVGVIALVTSTLKKKNVLKNETMQQSTKPTRTCASCGSKLPNNDKFCQICGSSIDD